MLRCPVSFEAHQLVAVTYHVEDGGRCASLLGTVCPLILRRLTVCQFFVIVLKTICSLIRIQALFNNCTIFYRGLKAFYIALGHVNPIENYYYYYYYYIKCPCNGFSPCYGAMEIVVFIIIIIILHRLIPFYLL